MYDAKVTIRNRFHLLGICGSCFVATQPLAAETISFASMVTSPQTPAPEATAVYPGPSYTQQAIDTRPLVLDYTQGEPIPNGYVLQRYTPKGYIIAGSITFGVGYGLGFLAATSNTRDKDFNSNWLFLPVLGPFIGLTTQHQTCSYGTPPADCGRNDGTIVALLALGGLQIVGASLFTYGVTHPRVRLVRQTYPQWVLAPAQLARGAYGLAATGAF